MELTPEQKLDVEARGKAFLEEYKALVDKHQVDLMSIPQFMPISNSGVFAVTSPLSVFDKKYMPVKSPFDPAGAEQSSK